MTRARTAEACLKSAMADFDRELALATAKGDLLGKINTALLHLRLNNTNQARTVLESALERHS